MNQEYQRLECTVWGILNKADTPIIEKHGSVSIKNDQFEEMKNGGSVRITIDVHDSRALSASIEDYKFTVTVKEFHKVAGDIVKTIKFKVPISLDGFSLMNNNNTILIPNEFIILHQHTLNTLTVEISFLPHKKTSSLHHSPKMVKGLVRPFVFQC